MIFYFWIQHILPQGEIINFIEALPFLNENAILVLHDIIWHFGHKSPIKFYPSPICLMPAIYGEKFFLANYNGEINSMGAVFLYPHQENHYFDYFLLLLNFWEYMPNESQIKDLRIFIKKYYEKDISLNIFNRAVLENKESINRFKQANISLNNYKNIMINLGNSHIY